MNKLFNQTGRGVAFAVTIGMLLLGFSAKAQVPKQYSTTVLSGYVMNQGSSSNLFGPLYIDVSKGQTVSFAALMTVATTDATNGGFILAPSVDGITMDTNHVVTVYCNPATVTGTNQNWTVTNINCGSLAGYFLITITNGTQLSNVTNSFKYGQKISAP